MEQAPEAAAGQMQIVVFSVEGKVLGVDILQVHEILRMVEITPFPRMPPFAIGAINLRGRIVPILNLRQKLNLPDRVPDARTCIILVRNGTKIVGFIVDQVSEVLDLPADYVESPENGPAWMQSDLFSGLGKLPGRLIVIINPERLLSPQEERLLPHASTERRLGQGTEEETA